MKNILPKYKKDLKILCVYYKEYLESDINKIAKNLNLNVTFLENVNNIKQNKINIENFDIIITAKFSSEDYLLNLTDKDNLKPKLFIEYERVETYEFYKLLVGTKIIMNYKFLNANNKFNREFYVLKNNNSNNNILTIKAILENSVNIYNEELKKLYSKGLVDFDLKKDSEYNEEYKKEYLKLQQKTKAYLEPYRQFMEMINIIILYLRYKEKGYIIEELLDLKIKKLENDKIQIDNIIDKKITNTIIFSSKNINDLISFDLIYPQNKKVTLGLYTLKDNIKYKELRRPNRDEITIIMKTIEKVNNSIIPLLKEVFDRKTKNDSNKKIRKKK